jgi:hydroxymethylglutaryl-CoA lyase
MKTTRGGGPLLRQAWRGLSTTTNPTVRLLEVGPRDGLQNIKSTVPTSTKIELIKRLAAAGLRDIEATSFVSPKWVPQLSDAAEVMEAIKPLSIERRLPILTPNLRGLEDAMKAGATEAVVFASATEAFSKKNQNCSVEDALGHAEKVAKAARSQGLSVRGVISCIFSDPYSGPTDRAQVLHVTQRLLDMGCHEVGLGDTLGVGTPWDTARLLEVLLNRVPAPMLAGHFHDTYGQAVANVVKAYEMGLRSFDSSIAGLGGCPYAPGAKGNVATEDLVYTFHQAGIETGIDLHELVKVGDWISKQLGCANNSRAGVALHSDSQSSEDNSSRSETVVAPARQWKKIEGSEGIDVHRSGTAVKITLMRPENGNAMTTAMVEGLTALFRRYAQDRSVFHIVLTATGKFFCTGMDLTGDSRNDKDSYFQKIVDMFEAVDRAPQITVAAIPGGCFGGGTGLSFACDIRLATARAKWRLTEVTLGLSPAIISKYLAREWGFSFLREAMLTGREIGSKELQRIGAVHGIADDAKSLDMLLDEYLDKLDRCAPRSVTVCKQLVDSAWRFPGGSRQDLFIHRTFQDMMLPGSEGEFGITQFRKKIKSIDWAGFWKIKSRL